MEKITLKYPLENGVTELKMRRPKVRDMMTADKAEGSDADKEITMFANLCEVTPEELHDLDMADYQQVQKAYKAFLA